MISKLRLQNFRTIEKGEFDFRKINVLIGSNNSGKSSVLYSLYALKNSIEKTTESIDSIYNLPTINLGGFKNVVHTQNENKQIQLSIEGINQDSNISFSFWNTKASNSYQLYVSNQYQIQAFNHITFPHSFTKNENWYADDSSFENKARGYWNGREVVIQSVESLGHPVPKNKEAIIKSALEQIFKWHVHELSGVDLVPINRTFRKNQFQGVPLGKEIFSEEEIISYLNREPDFANRLSDYLEKITERRLSIEPISAGLSTYLAKVTQSSQKFKTDLVNEGTGTNQLVQMLFKILLPTNSFICIDEPEIHMHPTMIRKFADEIVDIVESQEKQLLFSSHSEHFLTSLLANVSENKIKAEDICIYYLENDNGVTQVERQKINEMGQIEGGLSSFYSTPFKNFERIFKL